MKKLTLIALIAIGMLAGCSNPQKELKNKFKDKVEAQLVKEKIPFTKFDIVRVDTVVTKMKKILEWSHTVQMWSMWSNEHGKYMRNDQEDLWQSELNKYDSIQKVYKTYVDQCKDSTTFEGYLVHFWWNNPDKVSADTVSMFFDKNEELHKFE